MIIKILALSTILVLTGCAHVDPNSVIRQKNSSTFKGDKEELIAYGEKLWNDPSIGQSGLSCNNCHLSNAGFNKSFKQVYPHSVDMAKSTSGLESIDAEQMVQFCMLQPMKSTILPWDSKELAALTMYVEEVVHPAFMNK